MLNRNAEQQWRGGRERKTDESHGLIACLETCRYPATECSPRNLIDVGAACTLLQEKTFGSDAEREVGR